MMYTINLKRLTVEAYKNHLLSIELLPSRRVLLDSIEQRFAAISKAGIQDAGALMSVLSTPIKLAAFSDVTSIDEDYLKILKREINGIIPKSVALSEFEMLTPEMIEELKKAGLRSSKDFYESYPSIIVLDNKDSDRLFHLCSLIRINGIGALAAKMFLEAGYASAADIAAGHPQDMADKINALNDEKQYYNGRLGAKDMAFCITHAKMLVQYA